MLVFSLAGAPLTRAVSLLYCRSPSKNTSHLKLVLLKPVAYLFDLDPEFAHVIFKVSTRMFDI